MRAVLTGLKSFLPERAPLVLNFANVYFLDLGKRCGKVHIAGVLTSISVSTWGVLVDFFPALPIRPLCVLLQRY